MPRSKCDVRRLHLSRQRFPTDTHQCKQKVHIYKHNIKKHYLEVQGAEFQQRYETKQQRDFGALFFFSTLFWSGTCTDTFRTFRVGWEEAERGMGKAQLGNQQM